MLWLMANEPNGQNARTTGYKMRCLAGVGTLLHVAMVMVLDPFGLPQDA